MANVFITSTMKQMYSLYLKNQEYLQSGFKQ